MPSLSNHQSNDYTIEDIAAEFNRPVLLNEHGCWIWQGSTDQNGYGRYGPALVYGIVWRKSGRTIPQGHVLRHQCPNKACVNPDHIVTGTHKENMEDASRDGVMTGPRRVTPEQVEQVKILLKAGIKKKLVAESIGVSPQWISKFLKGGFKHAYAK